MIGGDPRAGRQAQPGGLGPYLVLGAAMGLLVLAVVLGQVAAAITGQHPSANPFAWVVGVATGTQGWSTASTIVYLVIIFVITGVVINVAAWIAKRRRQPAHRVDRLAKSMSTREDMEPLDRDRLERDAARLGVDPACGVGVPIGESVLTRRPLATSWEWTQLWVMGPRAGKTSCLCVPQIVSTGGPVVATSNKRDIVDLTRGPRSSLGLVRVHDPQGLVGEEPGWWWSPLSYVTDIARADEVVSLFAAATRDATAKTDAYFDTAAQTLVAALLLAAADGRGTLLDVHDWIRDPDDATPEDLLLSAGHRSAATDVRSAMSKTPKQRDGIYGSAENLLSWLRNPAVHPWITPGEGRAEFDPHAFVASTDTLYLLSREGPGSARALTAALTVAVTRAAEELGVRQGGRLRRPLLVVLDEAANVCRWPQLPDLYSHYGSRGIVLTTYLQSWSQGVRVWGKEGMTQMWDAANLRGVGPGVADDAFGGVVSRLVGDHDVQTRSTSSSMRGGGSTSTQLRREKILDVSDITAMPQGRAVVLASGTPSVMLRTVHWSEHPQAAMIAASEEHYAGQGHR